MLIKRLDVTIQSFLSKNEGKEDELSLAVRARRSMLIEEPTNYTVSTFYCHLIIFHALLFSLKMFCKRLNHY